MEEYFKSKSKELTVTIFNEQTWEENKKYKTEHNFKCIYSCSLPITSIEEKKGLYVLEADTTNNKIQGIGFIKNVDSCKRIYNDKKYNQYTYIGHYHIDRKDMNTHEEKMIQVLDYLCFYGKSHLKRYSGIKRFPKKWIYNMREKIDILEFLRQMFELRKENKQIRNV